MKLQSGHTVVPLEGAELKKYQENFHAYTDGLIRLMPGRWLYPTLMEDYADQFYNFKFKKSDVVLMAYPKCGTTWTKEIIWTMRNNPNLDNPEADNHAESRTPFIDVDILKQHRNTSFNLYDDVLLKIFNEMCPGKMLADGLFLQLAQTLPEPRIMKTHLPFSLMNPSLLDTAKVVFVGRNPKDQLISSYHNHRLFKCHHYVGSFEDFVQYFVDDDLVWGPYWLLLKEAWEKKDHPNLHIMFYEDMKLNPLEEYQKLDTFLGTNLTQKQLENIVEYTSFGAMKKRESRSPAGDFYFVPEVTKKDGGFFRKGESGDWKGKFTPELEAKVDQWIKNNIGNLGVNFKYEV